MLLKRNIYLKFLPFISKEKRKCQNHYAARRYLNPLDWQLLPLEASLNDAISYLSRKMPFRNEAGTLLSEGIVFFSR